MYSVKFIVKSHPSNKNHGDTYESRRNKRKTCCKA